MSKRFVVPFSALLGLVASVLVLVVVSSWISGLRSPLVTGEGVNATYQWSLTWDRSLRNRNYEGTEVFLSVDGDMQSLEGGFLGSTLTAIVANPGERSALDLSTKYEHASGGSGHDLHFPIQADPAASARYEVIHLANRSVHAGKAPVLLMRLELVTTRPETDSIEPTPRVLELWVGRELTTAQQ